MWDTDKNGIYKSLHWVKILLDESIQLGLIRESLVNSAPFHPQLGLKDNFK